MRAIKAVVIGMGVLILGGFIVVAITLVARMQDISEPTEAYKQQLLAPNGASLVETAVSDDLLVLRFRGADGTEQLLLVDPATGTERGRITFAQEP